MSTTSVLSEPEQETSTSVEFADGAGFDQNSDHRWRDATRTTAAVQDADQKPATRQTASIRLALQTAPVWRHGGINE